MFRLLGFPVHVRPGFVMFMVLIVVLYGDVFGLWLAGSLAAFTLLHELGHAVAARRTGAEAEISLNFLAGYASYVPTRPLSRAEQIGISFAGPGIQIAVSIKNREALRDTTGDPWGGRTLEWATASPAPSYNFAFTPIVHDLDAWYDMKQRGHERPAGGYRPIHMPRNTGTGVFLAGLALVLGFAMVWYIWWLAALAFAGLFVVAIGHSFSTKRDYYIPADEVASTERGLRLAVEG